METNTTTETQYDADGNEIVDMSDWPEYKFVVITGQGWACGDTHEECLKKIRIWHRGFRKNQTPYNLIAFTEPIKGFHVEMFRWSCTWADAHGGHVEIPFNGWGD